MASPSRGTTPILRVDEQLLDEQLVGAALGEADLQRGLVEVGDCRDGLDGEPLPRAAAEADHGPALPPVPRPVGAAGLAQPRRLAADVHVQGVRADLLTSVILRLSFNLKSIFNTMSTSCLQLNMGHPQ